MSPCADVQHGESRQPDRWFDFARLRLEQRAEPAFNSIQLLSHGLTFAPADLERTLCFADFRGQLGRAQLAPLATCGFAASRVLS